jgi:hypothetical protein
MSEESYDNGGDKGALHPFRDWTAIADFQPIVSPTPLRVRGEYFLNRRSGSARLEPRNPPGPNPTELTLDVVIDGSGLGGDWVVLEGRYPADEGQYKTVNVFDPNGDHEVVQVQEVH